MGNSNAGLTPAARANVELLCRALIRCFAIGFGVLLFWSVAILFGQELIFQVHGDLFGLTRAQLKVIHYCGMGLFKLFVFTVFLIPYLSIRWAMRRMPEGDGG